MKIPLDLNPGDFLDRLTIAAIRHTQVKSLAALRTLQQMDCIFSTTFTRDQQKQVMPIVEQLRHTNRKLWDVENRVRRLDNYPAFSAPNFIDAAREIYNLNDQRSRLKKEIDQMFEETPEEKVYAT